VNTSYSPEVSGNGNDGVSPERVKYVKCNACYGTGEDRHGFGDCLDCAGFGDIEIRY